jgi:hypothetical protein
MLYNYFVFATRVSNRQIDRCIEALYGVDGETAYEKLKDDYPFLSYDLFDDYESDDEGMPGVNVIGYDTNGAIIPDRPDMEYHAGLRYDYAVLVRLDAPDAPDASGASDSPFPTTLSAGIVAQLPEHRVTEKENNAAVNANALLMPMGDDDVIALLRDPAGKVYSDQAIVVYKKEGPTWRATETFTRELLGNKRNPFTRSPIDPVKDIVLHRVKIVPHTGGRRRRQTRRKTLKSRF